MAVQMCPHCGKDLPRYHWLAEYARSPEGRARTRQTGVERRVHGQAPVSGKAATPEYTAWQHLIQRCTNPKNRSYARYGGRGITVCDRWQGPDGFTHFLADMGPRPDGRSIDRIDNDGPYSPDNCRWATASEQRRNLHQPSGYRQRAIRGPVAHATKAIACSGGCGATGTVSSVVSRWNCPACRQVAARAAQARYRARDGKPTCSVDGCAAAVSSKGLCNRHYLRSRREH